MFCYVYDHYLLQTENTTIPSWPFISYLLPSKTKIDSTDLHRNFYIEADENILSSLVKFKTITLTFDTSQKYTSIINRKVQTSNSKYRKRETKYLLTF